tara:strand:+ start:2193 stop:3251 length:1059 start_codon:yes stop_codon:yes gene_type:complete
MKLFITDTGIKLPVSEKKYLIPFLTSATKGTKYWSPAPPNKSFTKAYVAEKILQIHQFIDLFDSLNLNTKNKTLLDIGTGNGLFPQTLLALGHLKSSVGSDLYEPYESESASIPKINLEKLKEFFSTITKYSKNSLNHSKYFKDIKDSGESAVFRPQTVKFKKLNLNNIKNYKFIKYGAHEVSKINNKFDIIYCKGIEHIHDWEKAIKEINKVSKQDTKVYFKIRSFFSYLGPHRYATTAIPWGHILLNDKEFRRYVKEFHNIRKKKMIESYYDTITYPRKSVSDLIDIFAKHNFSVICSKIETPPYLNKIIKFKNKIKKFDELKNKKYKNISSAEVLSSAYHIVFKKISKK